jgi:hypothetical protein
MRHLNSRFLVPACSFLVAVALSLLGGGPIGRVLARQAGGATNCTGSAVANSITTAAGSGIKKGTQGWTFAILDQTVTLTNSKTADLSVSDQLNITASNVIGIDTKNAKHPYGDMDLSVIYNPFPVKEYPNVAPPGPAQFQFSPAQVTLSMITTNLKSAVTKELDLSGLDFKNMKFNLAAQTVSTHQIIVAFCKDDGTDLSDTPLADATLQVDANGDGKATKKP